jgi:2-polyprenyl-3-methyl-5-hydroxy-6-metoxy-1,4-benzoquinol methylase
VSDSSADLPKPRSYFEQARPELVAQLPERLGRVLDVGCGAGGVGRALRGRAEFLAGIELEEAVAATAREVYDQVLVGRVEDVLGDAEGPFDTILAYDLLEHIPEPDRLLGQLRDVASDEALLHVSMPNARHWSLVRDLVVRGTFGYTDWGHRDNTHLRWFTRRDIEAAVRDAGWTIQASGPNPFRGRDEPFNRATRGTFKEFIALQWNVLAVAT